MKLAILTLSLAVASLAGCGTHAYNQSGKKMFQSYSNFAYAEVTEGAYSMKIWDHDPATTIFAGGQAGGLVLDASGRALTNFGMTFGTKGVTKLVGGASSAVTLLNRPAASVLPATYRAR